MYMGVCFQESYPFLSTELELVIDLIKTDVGILCCYIHVISLLTEVFFYNY